MAYTLEAHRSANKQLARLPKDVADGLRKALRALAKEPRSPRFDPKPIQGHGSVPPTLRLRLGSYRALMKISHERRLVRVLRVGTRETVYQGLEALDEGIGPAGA